MQARAKELFQEHQESIYRRTDRMFACLMGVEYVAGILAAWIISPRTWAGEQSAIHIHLWAAVLLGAAILSLPVILAVFCPGKTSTRHVIAIGQMLYSGLLIHLTGGRIETHFHIFGSLAFLGFYRDWRVLISASAVVALDHLLRGVYWPQSVYGVLSPSPLRWLEHTGWVAFEVVFITLACVQSIREMREIAERRAFIEHVAQERAENINELQLARNQLKEALEEKDNLMSVCGHELKTPLTSLGLQTQLAKRALQNKDRAVLTPEKFSRLIDQADSQVKRLLRLVQDMLDHSRIQAGKLTLHREEVDLSVLVQEVIERYQLQAESAGCSIWFENGVDAKGQWDRFRIEQVVTNLVTNAIKYGAGRPIEVKLDKREDAALISIRDHGMGISPENHERIFRQFERAGQTNHITGLGLGLYISKNIVEQHGGRIGLESEPGQGSVFTVEIPFEIRA